VLPGFHASGSAGLRAAVVCQRQVNLGGALDEFFGAAADGQGGITADRALDVVELFLDRGGIGED
jgi:hypothetical protein